jgi:hypothetical protein
MSPMTNTLITALTAVVFGSLAAAVYTQLMTLYREDTCNVFVFHS